MAADVLPCVGRCTRRQFIQPILSDDTRSKIRLAEPVEAATLLQPYAMFDEYTANLERV